MGKVTIEGVYRELEVIRKNMRTLLYAIGRYKSDIQVEHDDRTPMPAIIQTLGTMVTQLNGLRVDLTKIREAEQLEEG